MHARLFGSSLGGGSSYHPPHQDMGFIDKLSANLALNESLVLSDTLPSKGGKYVVSRLPIGMNTVKSPIAISSPHTQQ